jgi:hypothetical protein
MKLLSILMLILFSITLTAPKLTGRYLASENSDDKRVAELEAIICSQQKELEKSRQSVDELNIEIKRLQNFVYSNLSPNMSYEMFQPQTEFFHQYWDQQWEILQLKMQLSYFQNQPAIPQAPSLNTQQFYKYQPFQFRGPSYGQLSPQPQTQNGFFDFNLEAPMIDYSMRPEFVQNNQMGFSF